jgi:hypothetical protein
MSSRIVGYQVHDHRGNHWADRSSFEILTEETALNDLKAARNGQGCWLMTAILDGDIEKPTFEAGGPQVRYSTSEIAALVQAAEPLAELLFDDHPDGKVFSLEVDGGEVTRLKKALGPFKEQPAKS